MSDRDVYCVGTIRYVGMTINGTLPTEPIIWHGPVETMTAEDIAWAIYQMGIGKVDLKQLFSPISKGIV